MKILIDNGHGENTPGKRSPDGTFREYAYTREIADEVVRELAKRGYVAERIVKENLDVGGKFLHPFQDEMPGCIDGKFLHG